jgi:D-aspartate ligase
MSNQLRNLGIPIVLDLSITGLSVVRNLGDRGIRSIGIDSDPKQVGRFSRYCEYHRAPNLEESEDRFLSFLLEIGRGLEVPGILIPASDSYVAFVAKYRSDLDKYYKFKVSDVNLIVALINKEAMYKLAVECGLSIPRTHFPRNREELSSISRNVSFPCIIKPVYSHLVCKAIHRKLFVVEDEEELLREYEKVSSIDDRLVLQELIEGEDDQIYLYSAYCREKGFPELVFTGRKLRQYPPHHGTAALVESLWVQEVAEIGNHFLESIDYEGVAGIEFKKDCRDGQYKLMEINPRLEQWHGITNVSSGDLCYAQLLDLAGHAIPVSGFIGGRKWILVEKDFISSVKYMRAGTLTLSSWVSSLKGVRYIADFSVSDPLPFIVLVGQAMGSAFRTLFKLFWRK